MKTDPTSVAIYFECYKIGAWSLRAFDEGRIPLSGTDSMVLRLGSELARCGVDVTIYSNVLSDDESSQSGPVVRRARDAEDFVASAKASGCDVGLFNVRSPRAVARLIEAAEKWRFPVVLWDQNGPDITLRSPIYRSLFVRRIVTVSASQADELRDHPLFYKTSVVPNFIPVDFWQGPRADRNPATVCFLGSLTPSKGFQHLARAWPRVRRAIPDARLEVVGSARLYDTQAALGPLGVGDPRFEQEYVAPYLGATREAAAIRGVHFYGLTAPNEVRQILWRASLVVVNPNCSSSGETFCVSAAEASAAGAAVVGANRMGLRETVLNGRTGSLIDRETQLASRLISLIRDGDLTRRMGINGESWVRKNFTADQVLPLWLNLFASCLHDELPRPMPFSRSRADFRVSMKELLRISKIICGRARSEANLASLRRMLTGK